MHEHNEANPQETLRENDLILKINGEDCNLATCEAKPIRFSERMRTSGFSRLQHPGSSMPLAFGMQRANISLAARKTAPKWRLLISVSPDQHVVWSFYLLLQAVLRPCGPVQVTVLRMPRSVAPPPYAFGVKPACM